MIDNNNEWACEVMAQRMICSFGMVTLLPSPCVIVSNSPDENDMPKVICEELSEEILKYAYSYTERIVLTEVDGCMWGMAPSIFPSSSLIALMKFNISPKLVLALIKECGAEEMFELSPKIKSHPARQKERGREYKKEFCDFCERCTDIFGNMMRFNLCFGSEEIKNELLKQFIKISSLIGCPASFEVKSGETDTQTYTNTDFALITSFVLSILCFARVHDRCRSANVEIKLNYWSPAVLIRISPEDIADIRDFQEKEIFVEWERIVAEKKMPFGIFASGGGIKIGFQPHRAELSLMDVKMLWGVE